MYKIIPEIKKIAERVVSNENRRKSLADCLKKTNNRTHLFHKQEPAGLENVKMAAVDGGIVKMSLHGLDCLLVRSAGVCFSYSGNKIQKVEYFPSKFPTPEPSVAEAMLDIDWAYHTSTVRLRSEIRTAINCLDRFSPDILMLDGSILPHYSDKPAKSSPVFNLYNEVLGLYKELFKKSEDNGAMLCGVIEDSRSTRFCDIIKKDFLHETGIEDAEAISLLNKTKDTNLLFWALEKRERSREFRYSEAPQEHPVLKDFDDYSDKIYAFYLKTAKWDRPIRVEFLSKPPEPVFNQACSLASMLLAVSGQHNVYGLPTPLIEADGVAKLSENEIENLYSQILTLTGNVPSMFRLRRNQRPF